MFRYLVLGLLRSCETRHGYALMKEYRERSGLEVTAGNFYRELQRLVAEGLVRSGSNPPGADPRRTPYEITEAGLDAFDAWMHDSIGHGSDHEDELSSRTLFLPETDPTVARRILERWQEELWLHSKTLERARELALSSRGTSNGSAYHALPVLLARRLKHVAADLEFIDELRSAYEESAAAPRRATSPGRSVSSVGATPPGVRRGSREP